MLIVDLMFLSEGKLYHFLASVSSLLEASVHSQDRAMGSLQVVVIDLTTPC